MNLETIKNMNDRGLSEKLALELEKICDAKVCELPITDKHRRPTTYLRLILPSGMDADSLYYVNNLDAISKIEKIVIEKTSLTDYGRCLVGVTENHGIGLESIARIAIATAKQRAQACYLALSEKK